MKFTAGQSGNPCGRPKGRIDVGAKLRREIKLHGAELLENALNAARSGDGVAASNLLLLNALNSSGTVKAVG